MRFMKYNLSRLIELDALRQSSGIAWGPLADKTGYARASLYGCLKSDDMFFPYYCKFAEALGHDVVMSIDEPGMSDDEVIRNLNRYGWRPDIPSSFFQIAERRFSDGRQHMAELCGVSRITIYHWMQGERAFRISAVKSFADAVGKKLYVIFRPKAVEGEALEEKDA